MNGIKTTEVADLTWRLVREACCQCGAQCGVPCCTFCSGKVLRGVSRAQTFVTPLVGGLKGHLPFVSECFEIGACVEWLLVSSAGST